MKQESKRRLQARREANQAAHQENLMQVTNTLIAQAKPATLPDAQPNNQTTGKVAGK